MSGWGWMCKCLRGCGVWAVVVVVVVVMTGVVVGVAAVVAVWAASVGWEGM
jgi:hypothetical protein